MMNVIYCFVLMMNVIYCEVKKNTENSITKEQTKEIADAVISKTAESTLAASLKKIDTDNMARKRRVCNVVVKRVPESDKDSKEDQLKDDREFAVKVLDIPDKIIVSTYRAGVVKEDEQDGTIIPRPLIIKLKSQADAEYWHDYGRGHRTAAEYKYKERTCRYYVNEDLCLADRLAFLDARKKQIERRKQMEQPAEKQTEKS